MSSLTIRIGTRRSQLARVQTEIVQQQLESVCDGYVFEVVAISTTGDKNQTAALHEIGAKSLWTSELEDLLQLGAEEVADGKRERGDPRSGIDVIVHSLKDVPTTLPPDFVIGAVPRRASPHDALVLSARLAANNKTTKSAESVLKSLPPGSVIGTSSVRRIAQLRRAYPHLEFANVRGNIQTRLAKLDAADSTYSALVLASAGLERLGLGNRITSVLARDSAGIYHAVGQGALALEIRRDDTLIADLVARIDDLRTRCECEAERAVMRDLEGGCSVPIGVATNWNNTKSLLNLAAWVGCLDGSHAVSADESAETHTVADAVDLGHRLAALLRLKGADPILDAITATR